MDKPSAWSAVPHWVRILTATGSSGVLPSRSSSARARRRWTKTDKASSASQTVEYWPWPSFLTSVYRLSLSWRPGLATNWPPPRAEWSSSGHWNGAGLA